MAGQTHLRLARHGRRADPDQPALLLPSLDRARTPCPIRTLHLHGSRRLTTTGMPPWCSLGRLKRDLTEAFQERGGMCTSVAKFFVREDCPH